MLINPVLEDPAVDIRFDPDTGMLVGNERAKKCIDILGLNREGLPEARQNTYDSVLARYEDYRESLRHAGSDSPNRSREALEAHKAGRAPYSLAGRAALAKILGNLEREKAWLCQTTSSSKETNPGLIPEKTAAPVTKLGNRPSASTAGEIMVKTTTDTKRLRGSKLTVSRAHRTR